MLECEYFVVEVGESLAELYLGVIGSDDGGCGGVFEL